MGYPPQSIFQFNETRAPFCCQGRSCPFLLFQPLSSCIAWTKILSRASSQSSPPSQDHRAATRSVLSSRPSRE
ncbi:hypothetical protein V2G26_016456 [Clonostachys chloroleuca]